MSQRYVSVTPLPEWRLSSIGKPCPYCGVAMKVSWKTQPTRDHVFPKSQGFDLRAFNGRNRAIVCWKCNTDKADRDIVSWFLLLLRGRDHRVEHVRRFICEELELPTVIGVIMLLEQERWTSTSSSDATPSSPSAPA